MRAGLKPVILFAKPGWILRGGGRVANLDIDFVKNRAWNNGPAFISSLLTCTRSSSGDYYTKADGTLTTFAANTLRYGTNGLLVEEARTNLAIRSQEFDNASWSKSQATVSANAANAPDGTATADKLVEDGTTNAHTLQSAAITVSNATVYTASLYVKAAGRTFVQFQWFDGTTNVYPIFNLTTGTKDTDNGVGSGWTMTALANDWWRITITFTTGNTSGSIYVYPAVTGANFYPGDGTSGVYLWGAQLEAGSFPTSYIPTTTTSMARAADVVSLSTTSFGSGDRTWRFEMARMADTGAATGLSGWHNVGNALIAYANQGNANLFSYDGANVGSYGNIGTDSVVKVAQGIGATTRSLARAGSITDTPSHNGNLSASSATHSWDGDFGVLKVNRLTYWNTRLSDSALQALTA
jgi:hypothetical protein